MIQGNPGMPQRYVGDLHDDNMDGGFLLFGLDRLLRDNR